MYAALGSLAQVELTHLRNGTNFGDEEKFGRLVGALNELNPLVKKLTSAKSAKVAERERALDRMQEWFEDAKKPTFLWQLHLEKCSRMEVSM